MKIGFHLSFSTTSLLRLMWWSHGLIWSDKVLYGSDSPGREKWAICGTFFKFLTLYCDQTVGFFQVFSTADSSKYWPFFKILYRLQEGLERVLKKGKSSEFDPRNYEQVQSSPSPKVWSHKSIKDTVKLPKNLISSQKHKIFKNPKKLLGPKQKYF